MFDKDKKYILRVTNRKEEQELLTLFYETNIYWINKTHTPFSNLTLLEVFEMNKMKDEYPQFINLSYNNKEKYWVWAFISIDRKGPNIETKINLTKLIRKYKLEKINI